MSTQSIDVREAGEHFQHMLSLVEAGVEIILTDGATQLARVTPISQPAKSRIAGLHPGAMQTTADFDEPLSADFWLSR